LRGVKKVRAEHSRWASSHWGFTGAADSAFSAFGIRAGEWPQYDRGGLSWSV